MEIYNNITSKPYPYVKVDNKADTPARRQVITEVFGNCVSYEITGVDSTVSVTKQATKAIFLILSLPNVTVVEFTVHCQTRL